MEERERESEKGEREKDAKNEWVSVYGKEREK